MRVSISPGLEFDISLTQNELSDLETKTLRGEGQIRELPREVNSTRKIELEVRDLKSNLFVELKGYPDGASYEKITRYVILLSQEGYELLKVKGTVCDRTGGPSKVNLHVERLEGIISYASQEVS